MYANPKIGIYKILNTVNNKIYIGSSSDIYGRWASHKSMLNRNKHTSIHLQNAWNKHGESIFEFSIIEEVEVDRLIECEQYWLDFSKAYDPAIGYNILKKAKSNAGFKHSDETKAKIGAASKGRIVGEITRKKHSDKIKKQVFSKESIEKRRSKMIGRKATEEHKQKQSQSLLDAYASGARVAANLGKVMSDEVKEKISVANKGRVLSEEHKQKLRKPHKKHKPRGKAWKSSK